METKKVQRILFVMGKIGVEPLGVMLLSSGVKKHGHITDFYIHENNRELLQSIITFKPTVIALSMTTGEHVHLLEVACICKQCFPNIKIVAGGAHVTYFPNTSNNKNIDYIIRGDADYSFVKLMDNIDLLDSKQKDQSNRLLPHNLDALPFPDRELVYKYKIFRDNPVRNIMTSRGCPYSCNYCYASSYRNLYKGQQIVRYRSARNIVDECKELVTKYKTSMIFFADDEFSMNTSRLKELTKLYTKEVNIPFHCQLRIDILTEERVKLLKEMGCYSVTFAIESGNEQIRKKVLNRNIVNKQILDGVKRLRKYGLKFRAENMLGLPNETFSEMLETLKLNILVTPTYAWASIYQPFPNTALGIYCEEQGLYTGDNSDIKVSFTEDSVLKMSERDRMILRNFQRLFSVVVSFPYLYWLFRVLILFPFTDFYTKVRNKWKKICYKQLFVGVR